MGEPLFSRLMGKGDRKTVLLLTALALAGIVLVCLSARTAKTAETDSVPEFDEAAYTAALEERTCALLSGVEGVGEVQVMITVDSYAQKRYVRDRTSETAAGGSEKLSESVVLESSGSGTHTPVTESVVLPRVRGVSVVCAGGARADVQLRVTNVLSALFDLRSSQISVTN